MPRFDISVIIVVRDAEEQIGRLVRQLSTYLSALHLSFEVLVLDEGSSDNTLAVLSLLRAQLPQLEVIPGLPAGRGVARGIDLSRGQLLVLLHADEAHPGPLSDSGHAMLGLLLSRMGAGHDVAYGAPYLLIRRALAPVLAGVLGRVSSGARAARAVLRRAHAEHLRVAILGAEPKVPRHVLVLDLPALRPLLSLRRLLRAALWSLPVPPHVQARRLASGTGDL